MQLGELRIGDFVEWQSQGERTAKGKVIKIDVTGNPPEVNYDILASLDNPVAIIKIYHPDGDGGWVETDKISAKKFSTIQKISPLV